VQYHCNHNRKAGPDHVFRISGRGNFSNPQHCRMHA
jgi:hypothetical protein